MKRWPWLLATVSIAVAATTAIIGDTSWVVAPWILPTVACLMVGAVLASRVPGNPIGRLFLVFGVGGLVALSLGAAIPLGPVASAPWIETVSYVLSTTTIIVFPLIVIRFPTGKLASRRWRPLEIVVVSAGVIGGLAALLNNGWGGDPVQSTYPGPLRDRLGDVGDALSAIFFLLLLGSLAAAVVSVGFRYRRADPEERVQIRWLWFAAGLLASAGLVVGGATEQAWEIWVMAVAFATVPAAIGVAVTKYHLYDLDLVISRTVLVGILGVFVSSVYALVVVGIGSLIGRSDDLLLSIGSTALVALLFEPVRVRAQRWANRIVLGSRATPYEVLADLAGRLSRAESHEGILERMAERLAEGTGADRASVWVHDADEMHAVATYPGGSLARFSPDDVPGWVVPIENDAEFLGALSVETRRDEPLTPTERLLAEDLAHAAAAVLGRVRLDAALAERAKELAESRRRLIGAEEEERRRIERTMDEGVQQQVLGLKLRLGLAAQQAASVEATKTAGMLSGLTDEAQAAIEQIRSLARGIFPPLLQSEGLRAAVAAVVDNAPIETRSHIADVARLTPEVEAAVYFSVSEAITNAAKHAEGPLDVTLSRNGESVHFRVADQGPGFDPSTVERGSGLMNLMDRIEGVGGTMRISSAPGESTVVEGTIPLA